MGPATCITAPSPPAFGYLAAAPAAPATPLALVALGALVADAPVGPLSFATAG